MSPTARSGTSTSLRSAPTDTLGAALARRRSQHPLIFFIGRRLVALVFLCLGVSVMAFVLTTVVPSDPALANLGDRASSDPDAVRLYREHFGLELEQLECTRRRDALAVCEPVNHLDLAAIVNADGDLA